MARFFVRRNHPHAGVVTLCKVLSGSFTAKEMIVTEAEFIAATTQYLKKLSPAEKTRLRRAAAVLPEAPPVPPGNGEVKPFVLNKVAATG